MVDSALVSLLASAGVAGVFCVLFVAGIVYPRHVVSALQEEIHELKAALADERTRADAGVSSLSASHEVISALREGLLAGQLGRRQDRPPPREQA